MSPSSLSSIKWAFVFIVTAYIESYRLFSKCDTSNRNDSASPSETTATTLNVSLGTDESLGFFNTIPNHLWEHRREIARAQKDWFWENPQTKKNPASFFIENYYPFFTCPSLTRIGRYENLREICGPKRIVEVARADKRSCLVYSFDYQNNYQWETELSNYIHLQCEIHIFHPLLKHTDELKKLNIHAHNWFISGRRNRLKGGLGTEADNAALASVLNHGRAMNLNQTMAKLGHGGKTLDILRLDCVGCEFHIYKEWFNIDVRQLLVTTHNAPLRNVTLNFFSEHQRHGFVFYSKEPDIHPANTGKELRIYWGMLKFKSSFRDYARLTVKYQSKSGVSKN
jgi:hypothetical protein